MHNFYILSIVFFLSQESKAQLTRTLSYDSQDSLDKFYFKTFYDGTVYFKNNNVSVSKLNYQMPLQTIAYKDESDKTLLLSNIEEVDSVVVNGFKYIPVGGKFYEDLANAGGKILLLSYFGKYDPTVSQGLKDGSDRNSTSSNVSSVYLTRIQNQVKNIKYIYVFWLYDNERLNKIGNAKSFEKYFPDKKDQIKDYEKSHTVNFKDIGSVVDFYNAVFH